MVESYLTQSFQATLRFGMLSPTLQMTTHAVKGPFKKKSFSSEDPQGLTWLPGNMNGNTYAVTFKGESFAL
jgi:hypothetical protein